MAKKKVERLKDQLHKLELQATDKVHMYVGIWRHLCGVCVCVSACMCMYACVCVNIIPNVIVFVHYVKASLFVLSPF